ncbi:hypothetical protein WJX75_009679 [Coccomyxa subellipsoidea]|uniref:Uncharacterized protein n=1 Tax=Coccomyxa subellipsoidea TaxID=248742 RepID=A0ABR2Z4V0_9CHLO
MTLGSSRQRARQPGRLGNDDVGCDDENITYLKQLSREVTALEMLKHELLERNGRLERWHAEHPRPVPASQAGVSTDSSIQEAREADGGGIRSGTDRSCGEAAAAPPQSPLPAPPLPRRSPRTPCSPGCGGATALPR